MEEFAGASKAEQLARLELLGRNALGEFGVQPESLSPLVHAENTTFLVQSPQGEFCLRISRPGYQSNSNIRSEIEFLANLTDHGLQVPKPWQPRVVTSQAPGVPEPRDCVLFHWIDGEIHRTGLTTDQAVQVGELTAQLHNFVENWQKPEGFDRQKVHTWLLDTEENMEIDRASEMVREDDRLLLFAVATESRQMAAELPRNEKWIQLIHSDLHPANMVFRDGKVSAIDFDDTGYGFLIYDFAATLSVRAGKDGYQEYQDAVLEGYSRLRVLPDRTEDLLPQFLKLRLTSLSNWIAGRKDNPEFREIGPSYIGRICEQIRAI